MKLTAETVGKKFGRNWIFRKLDLTISSGSSIAVTGPNGSGKTTLLKILSGYLTPSEGQVLHDDKEINNDQPRSISFIGPYTEIPEEMTFEELLNFHSTFKAKTLQNSEIAEKASLPLNNRILDFSTGMKQRVQLSLAFYFKNEVLFMDEPTSNLDSQGFNWWKSEVMKRENTIVVASNNSKEIESCGADFSL